MPAKHHKINLIISQTQLCSYKYIFPTFSVCQHKRKQFKAEGQLYHFSEISCTNPVQGEKRTYKKDRDSSSVGFITKPAGILSRPWLL
jgi:hypothetical protein